jgi:uncharacterized protein (TIGR02466 family)
MIYKEPEINAIFPTPVLKSQLERGLSDKEIKAFNDFGKDIRTNTGNMTSVSNYVLEHDDLQDLKAFFQHYLNVFVEKIIIPKTEFKLYITQSWLNYTKDGEYHHLHTHPNSVISGVFYISAVGDKIIFNRKDPNYILDFETDNFQLFNSKSWFFEVKTNELFLFPSTLQHNVETRDNKKNDVRVSLAFNTFFKGHVGDNRNLTELKL